MGGSICNALNGFDLDVSEGEFVGIMGPSGAGKTTLLNIISTIDEPTSGNVVISGNNLKNLKEPKLSIFRRNMLGFIFQEFNLLDTLTIKENILLPLALSGIKVDEIEDRVKYISGVLGIDEILNKYPYEVSGGQKQKCAAARAVINNPRLILADEPVGSLDSKSSKDLAAIMPQEQKFSSYYNIYFSLYFFYGPFLFIGLFLGILFLLATGSVIYFKQLTEANENKNKYVILREIGVSRKEIKGSISKQMLITFGLPLIIGICHSSVALIVFQKLLAQNILKYCFFIITVYIACYIFFYFITVNSYTKIVTGK
jgi:ABC-type lipoprotein export system ATPase subunit